MNDNEIIQQYKKYEPFFGSWYIKRFVGEGGFARVFEIVRNDFGREYISALKIITVTKTKSEINTLKSEGMTDDDIRRYLQGIVEDTVSEIQLMYKLRGRGNIVSYEDHALAEHEDSMGWDILIKMEYLTSLSTYIRQQNGQLAKRDIIKLGIDICKSLEACQKYNIIHRDIKADNIFISEDGEFKLGDFGIARVIERKDQTLSKKGTSAYMAPEVYKGQTYTSAVDIYSLGMVMYRLMNNNRGPFLPPYPEHMSLDDRDQAMMLRMSGEKFPKPNQVSRGRLVEIVLKACAYRPEERYSSPGFMRQELEAICLDLDEMTTDEWVMIYDEGGRNNTLSTASFSENSITASGSSELTGATEVLREEKATEVLRGEATEVLREEGATEVLREEGSSSQSMLSRNQKICTKCGGVMDQKFGFCPICGASQQEDPGQSKDSAASSHYGNQGKITDKLKSLWKTQKALVIGSVSAAVVLLAVIIGVAASGSSDDDDTTPSGFFATEESPEPSDDPQETDDPDEEPQTTIDPDRISWTDSILMSDVADFNLGDYNTVFGSDLTRKEIITITFLDTLEEMPERSWDVSAEKNGKVMAWAEPRDNGYDLYISAEGGVVANENCDRLFEFYTNVENIQTNGCFFTDNAVTMFAMFDSCESLTSLDISGFHTSNVTHMSYMFNRCKNLTSLDISGLDTSEVTNMCAMFSECNRLSSVDVGGFNTSKVTDMSYMFNQCSSLPSVDVSGFDTSQTENMNWMFSECYLLSSVDVSGFNTSNVTGMRSMFNNCGSLTSVDAGGFDTSNVTDMSYMFNLCTSLTSANVSSFDTSNVTDMNWMFSECYLLTDVDVSGFNTSVVTGMRSMFSQCDNLTSVDVSGFDTSNVADMSYMFYGCSHLEDLDLSNFTEEQADQALLEVSSM